MNLLIRLSGLTRSNRLAMVAPRPAPVKASMIGYPHSTGAPQIDWLIGDAAMHPPRAGRWANSAKPVSYTPLRAQ